MVIDEILSWISYDFLLFIIYCCIFITHFFLRAMVFLYVTFHRYVITNVYFCATKKWMHGWHPFSLQTDLLFLQGFNGLLLHQTLTRRGDGWQTE